MQTLITGTPGAGKTLYAIEKLLLPIVGTFIKHRTDDGVEVEVPVKIYTNIKGLQIDHELVEPGPSWTAAGRDKWEQAEGNRRGWHNWHEWAPPGAVLVPDEFQKIWPPRPNGSPIPPDVQAMDTHRHLGVDFILITQSKAFDMHIMGLIGRHLHVRRIANMPMAIVYEWDGYSRSLLFRNAMSKSPWRYNRKVFKLYHSADLHTKQPRKIPPLLWVILAAVGLAAWKIPESFDRITGKGEQHQLRMAQLAARQSGKAGSMPGQPSSRPTGGGYVPSVPGAPMGPAVPVKPSAVNGCISSVSKCWCFDAEAKRMELTLEQCREEEAKSRRILATFPAPRPSPAVVVGAASGA